MEMGQGTRFAVLGDLHGNGDALRAVLTDLDECGGADRLLVLGDIVLLGPDPGEAVQLLMARDAVGVYGNTDLFLLQTDWLSFDPQNEEEEADRALCLWALERLDEQGESAGFVKRVLQAFAATGAPPPPAPLEEPSATATAAAAPARTPMALEDLTDRELDVLELLAERLQNKEIAAQLGISTHTVNYHLKHIYDKLGVQSRRQAVEQALERGVLDRSQLWGRTAP